MGHNKSVAVSGCVIVSGNICIAILQRCSLGAIPTSWGDDLHMATFSLRLQLHSSVRQYDFIYFVPQLMNEILSGAKVLKLYGWEKSFIGQVMGIRLGEVKASDPSSIILVLHKSY